MSYTSQHGEDKILEALFPGKKDGVCVEVGAYNGVDMSNTYYFETIGWRCLCIEPIPAQFEKCKANRKECVQAACTNKDNELAEFTVFALGGNESAISSLKPDNRLIESHKHLITNVQTIKVPCKTLTSILDECNYPKEIDFISIDTEDTEIDVLEGFDFNKYNVKVFVIENNHNEIGCETFLNAMGYKKIHRLAVNDFYIKQMF